MATKPLARILLVEDDQAIRETTADLLLLEGYVVDCASGGDAAVQYLTHTEALPDLILSDIMMAQGDGYALLAHTQAHKELQHMNRMLDDILLLNRADAARVDIRLRPVDLAQELQSILHDGELADGAQHTFHFAPTTADPAFVSDPNLLQHIFSNLLSNAVRYSPVGTTITLRLSFTVDAAIVEVEDQGIGIPLADQARIFDPFERGSNIGLIAGTGLGLNIVQRMVGLLQGTVAVSSITAGGTNFTVVLPRVIGPAPQP